MTEPTTTPNPLTSHSVTYGEGHPHAGEGGHAGDREYVIVALVLAGLTAIEVALSYMNGLKGLYLLIPLLVVMAIKFALVAGFFMHLRYDNRLLSRVFYGGLLLAASVYLAALTAFHVFRY